MKKSEPIQSASIILQRSSGEVYLAKRSKAVSFFPGFWVFPGGKLDDPLPSDWEGTEFEVIETVFRELYEEVGLVVGSSDILPPDKRKQSFLVQNYDDAARKEFKEKMVYIGKKQTPPFGTKVYIAAYFWIQDSLFDTLEPQPDGNELTEGEWIQPHDAVEQWRRGERKLPPPILHILRNMGSDHFVSISLNETYLPIGLQTKVEFVPGFQLVPIESDTIDPFETTNLTVISGDENMLIVDPGANIEGADHLRQFLLSLPQEPNVFVTHHHQDHWAGLDVVYDLYPEAVVYGSAKTLDKIDTKLTISQVEDGDSLNLGDLNLKVIATPGHTEGHLSLYSEERKLLIAGDHVVGFGSAVLDPDDGSMIDYFATTRQLIELDPVLIYPSHGPPNFNGQKLLQYYLNHRIEREDAILDAIKNGAENLDQIVAKVYTDVPNQMWEYAKRNIQLHLDKLADEDRLPDNYSC